MSSFSIRESRRMKIAQLIIENVPPETYFTSNDILRFWMKRWSNCPTPREMSKMIPALNLPYEKRTGESIKYYYYDGRKELYTKRTRD
jgi:hypothetical protein